MKKKIDGNQNLKLNKKIAIIDYGFGNIESLKNAINYLNFKCEIITNPNKFNKFTHVFLPGVGSFESGIKILKRKKWDKALKNFLENGNKLFGICLGMQLLFEKGTNEKLHPDFCGALGAPNPLGSGTG